MELTNGKDRAKLALNDAAAFNRVMRRYEVEAMIDVRSQEALVQNCKVFPAAVCIYKVKIFGSATFAEVTKYEREVRSEIAATRSKLGVYDKKMSVRFDIEPFLSLEVDTPDGYTLDREQVAVNPYQAAIGKQFSVDGEKVVKYDLNVHYQTLVAAVSGHGKSKLLKNCLLGLIHSTKPADLKFWLIDFKNDDLQPFAKLKHTERYAWKQEDANKLIEYLRLELEKRISSNKKKQHKILLVIDEGAELDKDLDDTLATIMKMGRSLGIHVLLATQYPTSAQIGQKIARAFTHRFVGRVESASSALWASGVAGSGAELLRKPGAFLYVFGGNVERFQTFNLTKEMEEELIK